MLFPAPVSPRTRIMGAWVLSILRSSIIGFAMVAETSRFTHRDENINHSMEGRVSEARYSSAGRKAVALRHSRSKRQTGEIDEGLCIHEGRENIAHATARQSTSFAVNLLHLSVTDIHNSLNLHIHGTRAYRTELIYPEHSQPCPVRAQGSSTSNLHRAG